MVDEREPPCGKRSADRDSGPETLYLEGRCFPEAIETERSVVTTQISELGRAQRRVRAVAPVTDRAAVTTVEPVPRIGADAAGGVRLARLQRGVLRGAGQSTSSGCAIGRQAGAGEARLDSWEPDLAGKPCLDAAGTRAIGRSSQRTSPALVLALSLGDRGGFRGA
jgi:hypothetical protein